MDFGQAISSCFRKYVGFRGRAPRSEYWYFMLFTFLVYIATGILDRALPGAQIAQNGQPLTGLAWLVLFLPSLAVLMRRLHDTGWSGWVGGAFYIFFIVIGAVAGVAVGMQQAHGPNLQRMYQVLGLLFIVGGIWGLFIFVLTVLKGHDGPNRYGPDPLAAPSDVF